MLILSDIVEVRKDAATALVASGQIAKKEFFDFLTETGKLFDGLLKDGGIVTTGYPFVFYRDCDRFSGQRLDITVGYFIAQCREVPAILNLVNTNGYDAVTATCYGSQGYMSYIYDVIGYWFDDGGLPTPSSTMEFYLKNPFTPEINQFLSIEKPLTEINFCPL